MVKELMANYHESTWKLDYTINLGTVIHLFGLLIALMGILVTMSAWKTATDQRLVLIEDRVHSLETLNREEQRAMYEQNERLARIEGKIDNIKVANK